MAQERHGHQVEGGCCALVVVYLLGKVYVANAGDSRYGGHTLWGEVVGVKNQRWRRSGGITDRRKGLEEPYGEER